jgi:hypothetical protein
MLSQCFQAKLIWVAEVAIGETVEEPERSYAIETGW